MKKKLLALNLALLALISAVAWRFRAQRVERRLHESKVLAVAVKSATAPPLSSVRPPQAVTAAAYGEIAQQMLFSQDRNPNVVLEVAPPKPLPPFPLAHGIVNFGDGPLVILSEKPGGAHRSYSAGEKVGEFTLVAVNKDEIVLEFGGQRLVKKMEELIERSEGQRSDGQPAPPAPSAVTTSAVTIVGAPPPQTAPAQPKVENTFGASGPGIVMYGQTRACQPGDTSPPGTMIGGLRKVTNESPFGTRCRWEPVQ